jgi:hypothetical protein
MLRPQYELVETTAHKPVRIGETLGRRAGQRFWIKHSDRLFHIYVSGQTGTGS